MLRRDSAGQEIVGEEGAGLLLLGYRMQIFPRGPAETGCLDVHQHRIGIDREQCSHGLDDPLNHLEQDLDVAALTSEVGRPEAPLAAEEGGDDRFVEGRVPADYPA